MLFWLAFGVLPEFQPEKHVLAGWKTRQNTWKLVFWLAFGVLPEIQPEQTVGYHPSTSQKRCFWLGVRDTTPTTGQKTYFLAGAQDIIRKPARKHVLAGRSGDLVH
ncbi:hypothetical protein BYT27DRAFT_7209293 [Phlegmacium glaucopus]|nr:hypothetical protein BYT27DRAFT_7209293 [Phlegmacium glaucopus]